MTIAVVVGAVWVEELIIPHLGVEQACTGQVGEYHTKGNGEQEQRLILLLDSQIEQHAANGQHDQILPACSDEEGCESHLAVELLKGGAQVEVSSHHRSGHQQKQCHEAHGAQMFLHVFKPILSVRHRPVPGHLSELLRPSQCRRFRL